MKWKEWIDIGYGPKEFHRDLNVFWMAMIVYALIGLTNKEFTLQAFRENIITVLLVGILTVFRSWISPSSPKDKP